MCTGSAQLPEPHAPVSLIFMIFKVIPVFLERMTGWQPGHP